jgi:hypothetical protein
MKDKSEQMAFFFYGKNSFVLEEIPCKNKLLFNLYIKKGE